MHVTVVNACHWHDQSDLDFHFKMRSVQEMMKNLPDLLCASLEMHYLDMLLTSIIMDNDKSSLP